MRRKSYRNRVFKIIWCGDKKRNKIRKRLKITHLINKIDKKLK